MSYSAVPTNYDQTDILHPAPPVFPPHEDTRYSHEKDQALVHQSSDVSIYDSESHKQSGYGQDRPRRSVWKTIKFLIAQLTAFVWIGFMVFLLYVNIRGWIIGASAWCPFGHCRPYQYGGEPDTLSLLAKFDKNSHDLLGALQFAAKALEILFVLTASAMVFRITMILIHMKDGLPLGYLNRPSEYGELTTILEPELYTTLHRMPGGSPGTHIKKRVAGFLALTIFLGLVCNLMGPAIAVLLIPQLQWEDTEKAGNLSFACLNSASPPGTGAFAFVDSKCKSEDFNSQLYSCAGYWPNAVDGWVASYQASENSSSSIFSVQDSLTISYNTTYAVFEDNTWDSMTFVPNRQVVQQLTDDWSIVGAIDYDTHGADVDGTYTEYTRTVQTYIHRKGPLLGAVVNEYVDFNNANHWTTVVGRDQSLRCYSGYNMSYVPLCWDCGANTNVYTRCIQVGSGWNTDSKMANFTISPPWNQYSDSLDGTWGPALDVKIYSSGKVAFLPNGTLPTGFSQECLPRNGTVQSGTKCDWDAFFATGDEADVKRHSKQVTTWEITSRPQNVTDYATTTTLTVDFSVYQTIADYSLDPSVFTNPMYAVDTMFLLEENEWVPKNMTLVPVDPAWSLAAFAVDKNGIMYSNRPTAKWISNYMSVLANHYQDAHPFNSVSGGIDGPTLMPIVQLMSMIDFNTTEVDTKTIKDDPAHPLLQRWAHINVWAYSMESRTSKFGIAVAVLGCLIVLADVVLSFAVRREFPSPLQLLVAAMEHRYNGEFRDVGESHYASMPFKINPDESTAGGFRFRKRD